MTNRQLRIAVVALIPLSILAAELFGAEPDADGKDDTIRIYLPRQKVIEQDKLTLGHLAICSGADRDARGEIESIPLGRSPFPGETITLHRKTIAARLARHGYFAPRVELTGATKIEVRRECDVYSVDDLVALAEQYLQRVRPQEQCRWKCIQEPEQIAAAGEVSLAFEQDPASPAGASRVIVKAMQGGKVLATRKVLFKRVYQAQRVVATRAISPGENISPDNAELKAVEVADPPGPMKSPFGLPARVAIRPGATIRLTMVTQPEPIRVEVKRNRMVRIKLTGPGWRITAMGQALQTGQTGDLIEVRNIDSDRVIVARIDEAGDVIPMMFRSVKGAR